MGKLECRWSIICSPTSFVLLPLLVYLLRSLPLTFVFSCLMQSWHRASSRKCLTTAQHKKCKTICTHYAPINVMPAGGEAGHRVGIWLFSKICNQIPCPRANHSSQMQPNFPTPGCTLLSVPRQNLRKAQ